MSERIAFDSVSGPLGTFDISTIRTYRGGGGNNRPLGVGFCESDYAEDEGWPFETVIFRPGSATGLCHAPYASESEALAGHQRMAQTVKAGGEFIGVGVKGKSGVPSMTSEEWKALITSRL